jgi:predicted permease
MTAIERWIYRRLLRLYPAAFRARFATPMLRACADRRAEAARRGILALPRFWIAALMDVVRNAAAERRNARARAARERGRRSGAGLGQDLRQALRNVRRQPGVTLAVLLTVGLGIGANATVFSAVNALLGSLPFPDAGRLVQVWQSLPQRGILRNNVTPAAAVGWQSRGDLFAAAGAYAYTTVNRTDVQPAERVPVALVTPGFFEALGTAPALGRPLVAADVEPGARPVAVISTAMWRTRFEGRQDVVGETVRLGGTVHAIVGVMPDRFEHLSWRGADLWTPLTLDAGDRRSSAYRVVARLRPGVSPAAAESALTAHAAELSRELGEDEWPPAVTITSLHESLVGDAVGAIVFVQAAALVVLLIACANLANLLLARAAFRRHEFAVRASLGAGRWQLVRQALIESLALGLAGGIAGMVIAVWGVNLIVAYAPADMPRVDRIRLDGSVLGAGFLLAGLTGLTFGIVPALRLARAGVDHATLGAARAGAGVRQRPLRWLAVAEIALAVVVVGAGVLLARALVTMQQTDIGIDAEGVVAAEVSLPSSSYPSSEAQRAMFDRMVARVAALPGVDAAGVVDTLPLSQSWSRVRYRTEANPDAPASLSLVYRASREYFAVVGIPLRAGRLFEPADAEGPPVVLVSESIAARQWPGDSAVGRRIWLEYAPEPFSVVGVVGDVRHTGLGSEPEAGIYHPISQVAPFRGVLVARTSGDSRSLIRPMRTAVAELDAALPLFNTRTVGDLRDDALAAPRLITGLTGLFAALALVLGLLGVYGIVAFSVSTRRRETGLRIALGARPSDVVRLFLRRGVALAATGLVLGLGGAAAAGWALASAAPEIPPPDAATLLGIGVLFGLATLTACYLPVRGALRVDPAEIMRGE